MPDSWLPFLVLNKYGYELFFFTRSNLLFFFCSILFLQFAYTILLSLNMESTPPSSKRIFQKDENKVVRKGVKLES